MKITASFEEGQLAMYLHAESEAEQRMLGAVIDQPQAQEGSAYLDKELISCSLAYEGHWSNKRLTRISMRIYRPNQEPKV